MRNRLLNKSLHLAALLGATVACAASGAQAASRMSVGDAAAPPLAFLDFCVRHAGECLIETAPAAPAPSATLVAAPAEPVAAVVTEAPPVLNVHLRFEGLRLSPPAGLARPWAVRRTEAYTPSIGAAYAVRLALASVAPEAPSAPRADEAAYTPELASLLTAVNRRINGAIQKQDDRVTTGLPDRWDLPLQAGGRAYGDCEDYVLEKRRALIAAGLPAQALSMAIARTRRGELHAVLVVDTDNGSYVLDNLSPWVTPWEDLNYTWIQRQVAGSAFDWATIQPA